MLIYVSKFTIYELVAVINGPVWPFVNPRKESRLKGVTVKVAEPDPAVKVMRFWAALIAKTPTELPTVVLMVAKKDADV
jgi:hypothetical protein